VLAPRGMLGPESLGIKSKKKKIFLSVVRLTNFYKNIIWHASTVIEEEEVKRNFGSSVNIRTAFNLPAKRQIILTAKEKKPKEARFVYMARIAPVKNLPAVIKTMNLLPSDYNVVFDIYGSNEDQTCWDECEPLIKAAPSHVKITYKGGIQHSEVIKTLQKYHFGVLYTKNENFGHTIIENLSVGLPVVISDRTPWNNLEEKSIGWNAPIADQSSLLSAIESACNMDQSTYDRWSQAAFSFASDVINNKKTLEANIALFN
jgi:glycosyltransferase involved in cell wall biosynthesis